MIKKEYKEKVNIFKESIKGIKNAYKADRPSLKVRIIDTVKSFVIKVKKIYKLVFRAWYLIRDLKDELIKIKDEIVSIIEATETNDAPVDFTINRLKHIL